MMSVRSAAAMLISAAFILPASADKMKNPTAVFAGLDKITGRIVSFEVAINETVQFGALQLTPKVCYSRPNYEKPQTTAFLEVDEITLANEYKRLFTGWIFAASPGLNAIDHPVYDIWLSDCKGGSEVIKTAPDIDERPASPQAENVIARPVPGSPDAKKETVKRDPNLARQAPSQSFFPTNAPPVPVASQPPPVRRSGGWFGNFDTSGRNAPDPAQRSLGR